MVGLVIYFITVALLEPVRRLAAIAAETADNLTATATTVSTAPLVGNDLASLLRQLSEQLHVAAGQAGTWIHWAGILAALAGCVTFAIPVSVRLLPWIAQKRSDRSWRKQTRALLETPQGTRLLAWRAAMLAPPSAVTEISSDPIRALESGDQVVMRQLALLAARQPAPANPWLDFPRRSTRDPNT